MPSVVCAVIDWTFKLSGKYFEHFVITIVYRMYHIRRLLCFQECEKRLMNYGCITGLNLPITQGLTKEVNN